MYSNGAVSNVKSVLNFSEHVGGPGIAPDHILALKPTAIIVYAMGGRAINIFENAGVSVLRANAKINSDLKIQTIVGVSASHNCEERFFRSAD